MTSGIDFSKLAQSSMSSTHNERTSHETTLCIPSACVRNDLTRGGKRDASEVCLLAHQKAGVGLLLHEDRRRKVLLHACAENDHRVLLQGLKNDPLNWRSGSPTLT